MNVFDYFDSAKNLYTPEIVQLILQLYEHKGKQELFLEANKDELKSLLDVAFIQSTKASNKIEGIFTTDKRLKELVQQKTEPHNRSEQEIAGYREVLSTIHNNYDYITPSVNVILQLHRDLYSFSGDRIGGVLKNSDNVIAQTNVNGNSEVRFKPVSVFLTESSMNELCENFIKIWNENKIEKLFLIPMFILDFLCIHPFNDGNGRLSRLLTLLLFYKAGFLVGKYISIEMIIEKSKESYYEVLKTSSIDWHENKNNYAPFVKYYLGTILKAYTEFESRIEYLKVKNFSKPERIKKFIDQKLGKFTKHDIQENMPDISTSTIERTLSELLKSEYIKKIGSGPTVGYVKIN